MQNAISNVCEIGGASVGLGVCLVIMALLRKKSRSEELVSRLDVYSDGAFLQSNKSEVCSSQNSVALLSIHRLQPYRAHLQEALTELSSSLTAAALEPSASCTEVAPLSEVASFGATSLTGAVLVILPRIVLIGGSTSSVGSLALRCLGSALVGSAGGVPLTWLTRAMCKTSLVGAAQHANELLAIAREGGRRKRAATVAALTAVVLEPCT